MGGYFGKLNMYAGKFLSVNCKSKMHLYSIQNKYVWKKTQKDTLTQSWYIWTCLGWLFLFCGTHKQRGSPKEGIGPLIYLVLSLFLGYMVRSFCRCQKHFCLFEAIEGANMDIKCLVFLSKETRTHKNRPSFLKSLV